MAESSLPSSSSQSNPGTNASNLSRKRRKIDPQSSSDRETSSTGLLRWRTKSDQQIYSSKLVDALRHLRRPDSAAATSKAVRNAADRVLAASARGKTRWSRAILTGRLSLRLNKKHKKVAKPAAPIKKPAVQKKMPLLQRKVKVLSRLVPGCRKTSLPNLLEETTDYIAALEMQVKTMTSLTALLNGAVPAGGDGDQYVSSSS
ncbi:hypothetical protein BUALT_Bualt15G0111400 [Buddleja alternifolia]|uniref:BHLH domain-containing protein n=1 Tax=Buddleja alternifolia TaxID=168488 RepID=A0AAV6WMK7_9LAMI|nr:hypothetical protein BUALT_Bualt15G0111400 [Buddleja alternifolia]